MVGYQSSEPTSLPVDKSEKLVRLVRLVWSVWSVWSVSSLRADGKTENSISRRPATAQTRSTKDSQIDHLCQQRLITDSQL